MVNAPGQRYHPVIIAQAFATLEEMFPGRFWAAMGSGEAVNEHVTGEGWPAKQIRNERLRESVDVLMEATPKGIDLDAVRAQLLTDPHVHEVHDLHVSQVATGLPVLTAHVVVDGSCFLDGHLPQLLDELQHGLAQDFAVDHSTIQFEAATHGDHEPATHD